MSTQKKTKAYGFLKTESPFSEIFPDRIVPLVSTTPVIIPHQQKPPPCYVVNPSELSPQQVTQLARLVTQVWRTHCESLEDGKNYVMTGLPLKVDWFVSTATDRRKFTLLGVSHNKI